MMRHQNLWVIVGSIDKQLTMMQQVIRGAEMLIFNGSLSSPL